MIGRNDISLNLNLRTSDFVVQVRNSKEVLREFSTALHKTTADAERMGGRLSAAGDSFRHFMQIAATARFAILDFYDVFLRLPLGIIKTSGEIERMTKLMEGLSTATDKVADANKSRDFVFALAQKAPYEVKSLTDAFVKLKSGGIDPMNGSMQALVDSVAKFGGSSDQLHRASIAIQQMGGKGVVSMEELRQQLGEAVPNAINMMATGVGKSMADMVKSISNGEVESKSALTRMFAVMAVMNSGAAEAMMQTWTGMMEQLKTKWVLFQNDVGGGASGNGVFSEARKQVQELLDSFDGSVGREFGADLSEAMYELAGAIRAVINGVIQHYDTIKEIGTLMLLAFGGAKLFAIIEGIKSAYAGLIGTYRVTAQAHIVAENEKTLASVKANQAQSALAVERYIEMEKEVVAKQAQVAALNTLHAETMAMEAAWARESNARRVGMTNANRAMAAEQAAASRQMAAAIALEGNALHSQTQVIRQNMVATQALIFEKRQLAAAEVQGAAASAAAGSKMAGMKGIFTAMGGWLTVITAGIMAAVWAWDKYGNAAEKNAERARRALNGMGTEADLLAATAQRDALQKATKADSNFVTLTGKDGNDKSVLKNGKDHLDALAKAEEEVTRIETTIRKNAADDRIKAQELLDAREIAKLNDVARKRVSELEGLRDKEKERILKSNASTDSKGKAVAEIDAKFGKDAKGFGREMWANEIARYQGEIDKTQGLLDGLKGGESRERSAVEATLKSLKDSRAASLEKLQNNELIGTSYFSIKGDKGPKGAKEATPTSSYEKYLENAERDLKIATAKQGRVLGEISKTQAIEDEVRAKFEALLDQGDLTKVVGKKSVSLDLTNAADKEKYEHLIRVASQAKRAKDAIADLAREQKALGQEQGELEQQLNSGGEAAEFANPKFEKLNAEYAEMQKQLLLDCENLDAANKLLEIHAQRLGVAARAANETYSTRSKKGLESAELDGITSDQEKARRQYEITTKSLEAEYAKRQEDTIKAREAGQLGDAAAQAELLKNVESFEREKAALMLRYANSTKSPIERLGEQWSQTMTNMNQATAGWAQGFMDQLTSLVTTGKADWRKFITSMLADMTRMNLQKTFGGAVTGLFGKLGEMMGGSPSGDGEKKKEGAPVSGLGSLFGDLAGGAKKLWASFTGATDATTKQTEATGESTETLGDSILKMLIGSTTQTTATTALQTLTQAALSAAAALNGTSGSSGGSSGAGGLLGAIGGFFGGGGDGATSAGGDISQGNYETLMAMDTTTSANGNVMTAFGPTALKQYANGGIAKSPQFSIFGEGSTPEAYVPLPDGRSIPVTMNMPQIAGGGDNVVISIVVNNNGEVSAESSKSSGNDKSDYQKLAGQIKTLVTQQLAVEQRPGGVLYRG